MRLTQVLGFYKNRMRVPGLVYDGKNRINPPVTTGMKRRAVMDLLREKKNVDILDKPYLSPEESFGHARAYGKKGKDSLPWFKNQTLNMTPHCYYEVEIRNSLEATKGWHN